MLANTLKIIFTIISGAFLLVLIFCYSVYFYQLRELPADTAPGSHVYPERIQRQFATANGVSWPLKIERLRPTTIFEKIIGRAIDNKSDFGVSESILSGQASRLLVIRKRQESMSRDNSILRRHIFTIWVSRHWDASETINTLLDESSFGRAGKGLDNASRFYFDLPPEQLRDDELQTMFAIMRGSSIFDPWCRQERVATFVKQKSGLTANFDRLNTANKSQCK